MTVEGIKSKNLIGGWYSGSIDTSTGADISSSVAFRTDYIPVDFVNNSNYRMSGAPSSTYNNVVAVDPASN